MVPPRSTRRQIICLWNYGKFNQKWRNKWTTQFESQKTLTVRILMKNNLKMHTPCVRIWKCSVNYWSILSCVLQDKLNNLLSISHWKLLLQEPSISHHIRIVCQQHIKIPNIYALQLWHAKKIYCHHHRPGSPSLLYGNFLMGIPSPISTSNTGMWTQYQIIRWFIHKRFGQIRAWICVHKNAEIITIIVVLSIQCWPII